MSSEDCVFCKIVKRQVPASVVFEDDCCMAFMDIFPIREGHCLLIPKSHYTNLLDVDLAVMERMSGRLVELTRKVYAALRPNGVLVIAANGTGAGQEIPHLHFHVLPRNSGDEFRFQFPKGYREKMALREELDAVATRIRNAST
ncbi:MAG: HIT family protein [Candidatus Thorarchaeota archaeon]